MVSVILRVCHLGVSGLVQGSILHGVKDRIQAHGIRGIFIRNSSVTKFDGGFTYFT